MAGPLADVIIALRARNEDLEKDLADARRKLKQFGQDGTTSLNLLNDAALKVGGALAAIGAARAFSTLVGFVKSSLDAAAATTNLADALGISTAALQKLHFAAEQSGISTETIDAAIGRLSKNAVDAASGNEQLRLTFLALGIDLKKNRELLNDLPRLLELVLRGSDRLGTAAEKNAARIELLGKGTAELGALAANAGQRLAESFRTFENLHLGISDEDLRRAAAANDAIGSLGATVRAEFDKTINHLNQNSSVQAAADTLAQVTHLAFEGIRRAMDTAVAVAPNVVATLGPVGAAVASVTAALNALKGAEDAAKGGEAFISHALPGITLANPPKLPPTEAERARAEAERRRQEEDARRLLKMTAETHELQLALEGLSIPKGFDSDLAKIDAEFARNIEAAGAFKTAAEREQGVIQATLKRTVAVVELETESLRRAQSALGEVTQEAALALEPQGLQEFDRRRVQAIRDFQKAAQEAGSDPRAQEAVQETFRVTMESIDQAQASASSFVDFLKRSAPGAIEDFGKQLSDGFLQADFSFSKFLRTFLAGVERMVVEAATLLAVKKALEIGGSFFGSSALTGIAGAITLGTGGFVGRPTAAIVGDAPGGEWVIPNEQMKLFDRQGDGGVALVIENNGPPLAVNSVTQTRRGQMREIRAQVSAAIAEDNAANGVASRSFQQTFAVPRAVVRRG